MTDAERAELIAVIEGFSEQLATLVAWSARPS